MEGDVVAVPLYRQAAVLAVQHTRLHHLKGHFIVLLTQSVSWWWCKASYRTGQMNNTCGKAQSQWAEGTTINWSYTPEWYS